MVDIKEAIRSFVFSFLGFALFGTLYLIIRFIYKDSTKIDIGYWLGVCFAGVGAIIGYFIKEFVKLRKETIEKIEVEISKKANTVEISAEFNFKIEKLYENFSLQHKAITDEIHEYMTLFEGLKEQITESNKKIGYVHNWFMEHSEPKRKPIIKKHTAR